MKKIITGATYFGKNYMRRVYRRTTSHKRLLPEFIIAGAQRCGTTSLYKYLIEHPNIEPALRKEIHYFDYNFDKKIDWYKSHFSISDNKKKIEKQ